MLRTLAAKHWKKLTAVGVVLGLWLGNALAQVQGFPSFVPILVEESLPTQGAYPGQFAIIHTHSATTGGLTAVDAYYWDSVDADWHKVLVEEDAIDLDSTLDVTGASTFASTVDLNGSTALGDNEDDLVTANAPVVFEVIREDFDGPNFAIYDNTNGDFVPTVADTESNIYEFTHLNIYTRIEQGFGGTNTPGTYLDLSIDASSTENRVWKISDPTIVDAFDNDAIEYNFGGDPTYAILWDETSGEDAYCEVSVRIDDISDLTANDFYFGFFLAAAINDAFGYESANTYATFSILDNAGDLVIATDLNGGGTPLEDDSGTTWADDATHVLRVVMSADSVSFSVDGTAVTQTNAVLDADDDDEFVCRLGYRSSGADAGVELNYVEIGREQ